MCVYYYCVMQELCFQLLLDNVLWHAAKIYALIWEIGVWKCARFMQKSEWLWSQYLHLLRQIIPEPIVKGKERQLEVFREVSFWSTTGEEGWEGGGGGTQILKVSVGLEGARYLLGKISSKYRCFKGDHSQVPLGRRSKSANTTSSTYSPCHHLSLLSLPFFLLKGEPCTDEIKWSHFTRP